MSTAPPLADLSRSDLRARIEDLYAEYVYTLDDGNIEDWPNFFTEDCLYKVVSRENHDRGLPLATMLCESKGYLLDRVRAVVETSSFAPRQLRHVVSSMRLTEVTSGTASVEANFAVFQTMADQETSVFMTGRYLDEIVLKEGQLLFAEKRCIYDTNLVPNSLIYPL
jgi:3-phenylpropionate/cinnamic acid dioxygenase small subunit